MPEMSFLRFDEASGRRATQAIDLQLMYAIYTWEAKKVQGSHGGSRLFSDCIWKVDDEFTKHMEGKLGKPWSELQTSFDNLVEYLVHEDQRHMLRFKKGEEWYHITKLAEGIRTTGNLHEFQNRKVQKADGTEESKKFNIIEGTAWYPLLRYGTPRQHTKDDILAELTSKLDGITHLHERMGGHTVADALEDVDIVLQGIAQMPKYGGGLMFSKFQMEAIVKSLLQSWTDGAGEGEGLVITADTGMGKTLAFGIPVLVDSVITLRNENKTMSQLIMYPRVALAEDQYSEFKKMAAYINKLLLEAERPLLGVAVDADGMIRSKRKKEPGAPRYTHYPLPNDAKTVDWGAGQGNVFQASRSVYSYDKPAQIVLASIESFRRRLRNPAVMFGLKNGLSRIVFDEVHLSTGTQGAHHRFLVSRLKQLKFNFGQRNTPRIIGVSATIAEPLQHLQKIWGGPLSKIKHVAGRNTKEGTPVSIMHHVMYKPRNGTPVVGALVDLSSSILHQRRAKGVPRPAGPGKFKKLQKAIGFADSHQIVGDWYSFMLDNEATSDQNQVHRKHDDSKTPLRKPYAHWHDRPLKNHPGGEEVCAACQKGTYASNHIELGKSDLERLWSKTAHTGDEPRWDLPNLTDTNHQISGLDSCTYLEHGKCWWFAPKEDTIGARPGHDARHAHVDVIRTKRFTSITKKAKTANDEDEQEGEGGANKVFNERPQWGAYPRYGKVEADENKPVLHDFVLATPTLEVGVDMDNVSEVLTHKAIRNIASYRQKVGRAGREKGSDALAVTLASRRATDFQHFRSMRRLVADDITEPVPIATNNTTIIRHHAYESVFDYLSREGCNVEAVPKQKFDPGNDAWDNLDENISEAIGKLDEVYLKTYIHWALNGEGNDEIITRAIETVRLHLSGLLETFEYTPKKAGPTYNVSMYQWLAHYQAKGKLSSEDENYDTWNEYEGVLDDIRNALDNMAELLKASTEQFPDVHEAVERVFGVSSDEFFTDFFDRALSYIKDKHVENMRELESIDDKWNGNYDVRWGRKTVLGEIYNIICADIGDLKDAEPMHQLVGVMHESVKKKNTYYLSNLLESLPYFLENRPFIGLPSYFTNPHEATVDIYNEKKWKIDTVTSSEALRYLLPGMHTRRLNYGNRMFVDHTGELEQFGNEGVVFAYDMAGEHGIEHSGASLFENADSHIPKILGTKITGTMRLYKLKELVVSSFDGLASAGRNFCSSGSPNQQEIQSKLIGDLDIDNKGSAMLIPKTYGIEWRLVETTPHDELQTYLPKNLTDGENTVDAKRHPLLNHLFSHIDFDDEMSIKNLGLGVSRGNGLIIQAQENQQSGAFVHEFTTQGLNFVLCNTLIAKADAKANQVHQQIPFSSKSLDMLGYSIRSDSERFGKFSGFAVDGYLESLVEHVWKTNFPSCTAESFPETEDEFFQLVFNSGEASKVEDQTFDQRAEFAAVAPDTMKSSFLDDMTELKKEFLKVKDEFLANIVSTRRDWYELVLTNTLGVLLTDVFTAYSGVQPGTVAYATSKDNQGELNQWTIHLYDNEPEGNGSSDLAKRFLHIPIEIRNAANNLGEWSLPTESFADCFERKMTVCMDHYMHKCAIQDIGPSITPPAWFMADMQEFKQRFGERWDSLDIKNPREAQLHMRRRWAIESPADRAKQLDLELALHLCDDGCTVCGADAMVNQYAPLLERYVTNRGLLDELVGPLNEINGYARQVADEDTNLANHGEEIPNVPVLQLQPAPEEGKPIPSPLSVRFVHHLGVGVGFAIERSDDVDDLDILVRTKDVV